MVRHERAPTSCARPRWFAFPELLSLLLQNSLEAITNANKKHGLRPVLELYTLTDGPCSTQITVTGRWAGPETPYSGETGLVQIYMMPCQHLTRRRDSPHCRGASCRCSRTSWLRTPSTLASPRRCRDGWVQLRKKLGDTHGGHQSDSARVPREESRRAQMYTETHLLSL